MRWLFAFCLRWNQNLRFVHLAEAFGERVVFDLELCNFGVLVGSDNDEFGDREGDSGVELID